MRAALILAAALSFAAHANAVTGNQALNWHRSANGQQSLVLLAYVRGAVDSELGLVELLRQRASASPAFRAVWAEMAPKLFCPPEGADIPQAYDILVSWLEGHPEERQAELAAHLRVALRRAWRCSL